MPFLVRLEIFLVQKWEMGVIRTHTGNVLETWQRREIVE